MDERAIDVIDHSRLKALLLLQRPGRPAVLDSIFELFIDGTPGLVDKMQAAVAAHDRSALRVAAHTVKSSSANLGAVAFSAKGKRIEIESETADWPSLQSQVDELASEVPTIMDALLKAIESIR